jgi:hypothetical protein
LFHRKNEAGRQGGLTSQIVVAIKTQNCLLIVSFPDWTVVLPTQPKI